MPASPPRAVRRPVSKARADVIMGKARGEAVRAIGAPAAPLTSAALQEVVDALKRSEEAATHASRLSAMASVQFTAEALAIKEARLIVESNVENLNL